MAVEAQGFYNRLSATAYRLIYHYGVDINYYEKIKGAMDVVTGKYETVNEKKYTNIKAIIGANLINETGFGHDSIHGSSVTDNETIIDTDMELALPALNLPFTPSVTGEVEIDGKRYEVGRIIKIPPAGFPIFYKLFVGK